MNEITKSHDAKALEYHAKDQPGKIAIIATKSLINQHDLALAYSPGVAAPCLKIFKNPDDIYKYTSRGNMVAVISNGSAVLGLGNLGAAASKPVMEGKAVLFKSFADIDSIDIEIDTQDPQEFINAVRYLGYSWGGINLEDIKAPECFIIEQKLQEYMQIPVFHDDQHGTAIVTAAGLINAAYLTNRTLETMKIVVNGAGAAALACIDLLLSLGVRQQNLVLCDTKGVIYRGRTAGMNEWKEKYATDTNLRSLAQVMQGADMFLGLSAQGAVSKAMIAAMADQPIIFAMANPDPEITPEEIKLVRSDAIIATGRSDYNNQVNNVIAFPYVFRGALDVRAVTINREMKLAASRALAQLARQPVPDQVYKAYPDRQMSFGPDYIIPVPFDRRLLTTISVAVAQAAIDSGVAGLNKLDVKQYKLQLESRFNPVAGLMTRLAEQISAQPQKVVLTDGGHEEVIKAAIILRDNYALQPIILGCPEVTTAILKRLGQDYNLTNITIINPLLSENLDKYTASLYQKLQHQGHSYDDCAEQLKHNPNIFASLMLDFGAAGAMVAGPAKSYSENLAQVLKIMPAKLDYLTLGYSVMIGKQHQLIIAGSNELNQALSAEDIVKITKQSASIAKNLGYYPRIALSSLVDFEQLQPNHSSDLNQAIQMLNEASVDFEYDSQTPVNIALNPALQKLYPGCRLSGPANILIMPNLSAALIAKQLLQEFTTSKLFGPLIDGFEHSVQIAASGSSAEQIADIAVFAAAAAINNQAR